MPKSSHYKGDCYVLRDLLAATKFCPYFRYFTVVGRVQILKRSALSFLLKLFSHLGFVTKHHLVPGPVVLSSNQRAAKSNAISKSLETRNISSEINENK